MHRGSPGVSLAAAPLAATDATCGLSRTRRSGGRLILESMKTVELVRCVRFPCLDVDHGRYVVPEVDVAGGRVVIADRPGLVTPFDED